MNAIRLRNKDRVYDLFNRIAAAASGRGRGNILRLRPYTGAAGLRTVAVDSTEYPGFGKRLASGDSHKLDGSRVTLWYKAMHKPTAEQIAAAEYAVKILKLPRQRYTGTLVDVFIHKGSLYCLLAGVLERDRAANRHGFNFRHFNIEDGDLYAAVVEEVQWSGIKALAKTKKAKGKKVHVV